MTPDDRTACPACGRPNSVKLKRCMYCGAALVATADGRSLDPRDLNPHDVAYVDRLPSVSGRDFYVSTGPFAESELTRVETYARLVSREQYTARQLMLDARPRVVAQDLDRDAARDLLGRLLGAGLRAAAGTATVVAQLPPPVTARRAAQHPDGVGFTDDRGGDVVVPAADLRLVVLGKVTTRLTYQEQETVARYHGGSLVVHAQARDQREVSVQRHRSERSHDHVLDLHTTAGPVVRLVDSGFELASAGVDPRLNRGEAFDRLVQRIREWAPSEYFDNSFEAGLGEAHSVAAFFSADRRSDARQADNLAAFDAHSRLFRVHLEGLLAGEIRPI